MPLGLYDRNTNIRAHYSLNKPKRLIKDILHIISMTYNQGCGVRSPDSYSDSW